MSQCTCVKHNNTTLAVQGETLLRRLGIWEVVQHVGQIDRTVSAGHKLLRRIERGKALGIDVGRDQQIQAEREFALARRHASAARQVLRELTSGADWMQLTKAVEGIHGSKEFGSALQEAQERWAVIMLDSNLPTVDVTEIMGIWESVLGQFRGGGFEGLFKQVDERLGEFDTVLRAEEDWGRRPHSPLETWQWILIAIIIGVAIAAVVACLIWSGCSWIYAVFVGVCIGVSATGAWFAGICLAILG